MLQLNKIRVIDILNIKKILLGALLCGSLLTLTPIQGHAIAHSSGGHASAGGHASTGSHATATHTTTSRGIATSRPSSSTTTTARPSVSSGNKNTTAMPSTTSNGVTTVGKSSSTSAVTNKTLPATESTKSALNNTYKSSTYKNLNDPLEQNSYSYWRGYYGINSMSYPYISSQMNHHYFWVPWWIMYSNHAKEESKVVKEAANKHHMKWIKIGDNVVYLPEHIYKKVKVGDKVTLLDDNYIKINDKIYSRK